MSEAQGDTTQPARKVITVTLNPSLDRTLTTHFLSLGYTNRVTGATRLDPAGRGVNVSRALHALGEPTHAILLLGHDATGLAYEALLAQEGFPVTVVRGAGSTRSNIIITDTGHGHETMILEDSRGVTRADRQMVSRALLSLIHPGDFVVFAGSLPSDVRPDTYAQLTSLAQAAGAHVALNAGGGDPLKLAVQARPNLIYLTQSQMEGLMNVPVRAQEDVIGAAKRLQARGVQRVLVALEETRVAYLVAEDAVWRAEWPDTSGTRVGLAGAMIAGFLAGRLEGESFEKSLQLGAATAVITLSRPGRDYGTREEVEAVLPEVHVGQVDLLERTSPPERTGDLLV